MSPGQPSIDESGHILDPEAPTACWCEPYIFKACPECENDDLRKAACWRCQGDGVVTPDDGDTGSFVVVHDNGDTIGPILRLDPGRPPVRVYP